MSLYNAYVCTHSWNALNIRVAKTLKMSKARPKNLYLFLLLFTCTSPSVVYIYIFHTCLCTMIFCCYCCCLQHCVLYKSESIQVVKLLNYWRSLRNIYITDSPYITLLSRDTYMHKNYSCNVDFYKWKNSELASFVLFPSYC